jgi:hypothetical protein
MLTSAPFSRSPPTQQLMVHPALGGVSGEGWASSVDGLCSHRSHLDATINGVSSFVIFDGDFLLAARQFPSPEAANSHFPGRKNLLFSWEEKLVAPLIATPNVDKVLAYIDLTT